MKLDRQAGSFLVADRDGLLHRPVLNPDKRAAGLAIAVVNQQLAAAGYEDDAELFLRGSAARDELRGEVSDVDVVVLLRNEPGGLPRTSNHRLGGETPGPVAVEFYTLGDIGKPRFGFVRSMIALEGVHVDGSALFDPPSTVRLSTDLYFNLLVIDSRVRSAEKFPDDPAVAGWVAKSLIRAAFESVMINLGVYTRDISACCRAVEGHLPGGASPLWPLASSYVDGNARLEQVVEVLARLRPWFLQCLEDAGLSPVDELRDASEKADSEEGPWSSS